MARLSARLRVGISAGAFVATPSGAVPIEDLAQGDTISTRRGPRVLRDVVRSRVAGSCQLLRVSAGALTVPGAGAVWASGLFGPGQRVLVTDWRARALYGREAATPRLARLEDGEFVRTVLARDAALFGLVLGTPEIVFCNGVPVVSADAETEVSGDLRIGLAGSRVLAHRMRSGP